MHPDIEVLQESRLVMQGRDPQLERAVKAKTMQKTEAVDHVVRACEELAK